MKLIFTTCGPNVFKYSVFLLMVVPLYFLIDIHTTKSFSEMLKMPMYLYVHNTDGWRYINNPSMVKEDTKVVRYNNIGVVVSCWVLYALVCFFSLDSHIKLQMGENGIFYVIISRNYMDKIQRNI
jgi:hypothetical protein